MDRKEISIYQPGYESPPSTPTKAIGYSRPKSAMLAAIEDRVFSVPSYQDDEDYEEENILEQQEFLHLGPLELKLLCVNGNKMPITNLPQGMEIVNITSTTEDTKVIRPNWPITPYQIKAAVEPTDDSLVVSVNIK